VQHDQFAVRNRHGPSTTRRRYRGKLAWDAFAAQYFPERRRHDLEAVAAYGAYKQGRDWRNDCPQTKSPPRLTLVPSDEPIPLGTETEATSGAAERLLVAVAAEQLWEGEGGRTFW
jgi:hypothetical protein